MISEEVLELAGYRCRAIKGDGEGIPILFLHGYSFTNHVWMEIGLLQRLEEAGIPFLAPDMPYGMKSSCDHRSIDVEENSALVGHIVDDILGEPPLIVGASLGGVVALHYAAGGGRARGLVLAAPPAGGYRTRIPALLIWGTMDEIVDEDHVRKLAEELGAQLLIYEGARHPVYLDYPDKFEEDLLKFYRSVTGGR